MNPLQPIISSKRIDVVDALRGFAIFGVLLCLCLNISQKAKMDTLLTPIGRMAFTNYVSQTVISIVLFYGIGFKLAGKFGFTFVMGICIIIFLVQIQFSKWWLSKFQFGPLEWAWRSLTHGKKQPFRKAYS